MKLFEAIEANDPEAAAKALKRIKNINRQMRDNGYTPLSYAAKRNADRVIRVLLEAGADPKPGEVLATSTEFGNRETMGRLDRLIALLT